MGWYSHKHNRLLDFDRFEPGSGASWMVFNETFTEYWPYNEQGYYDHEERYREVDRYLGFPNQSGMIENGVFVPRYEDVYLFQVIYNEYGDIRPKQFYIERTDNPQPTRELLKFLESEKE